MLRSRGKVVDPKAQHRVDQTSLTLQRSLLRIRGAGEWWESGMGPDGGAEELGTGEQGNTG